MSKQVEPMRTLGRFEPCCDVMRNAILERAVSVYEGRPEIVGEGSEETNNHFPLIFCPFCQKSIEGES